MRSLVVFYTRTGVTKVVAETIAKELDGDLEELVDLQKRSGPIGFLRSGRDATQRKLARIQAIKHDPSQYDLVVVGTPIWSSNITPAVRTYLSENKDKIKEAAFFTICGGTPNQKGVNELKKLYGKDIKGALELARKEIGRSDFVPSVQKFVSQFAKRDSNVMTSK